MIYQPLAERLRPRTLDDYIGQTHLVGQDAVIRRMIETGRLSSFILGDHPGWGKQRWRGSLPILPGAAFTLCRLSPAG